MLNAGYRETQISKDCSYTQGKEKRITQKVTISRKRDTSLSDSPSVANI